MEKYKELTKKATEKTRELQDINNEMLQLARDWFENDTNKPPNVSQRWWNELKTRDPLAQFGWFEAWIRP